jgi:phosphoribosyl 1,2-cyclic phosphodiesterase
MIKVCVLASGSKGNAIYIADENTAILIDAGMSGSEVERRLCSRDFDPETLDAVIVSHEHADHTQGVGVLSRRFRLPVYISELTLQATNGRMGPLKEVRYFCRGAAFKIGSFRIRPFAVSHDAADPVGFTIDNNGTKIGIATDLGAATQLVRHHLQGCRLLVLEANHDLRMLEEGPYPWELKQRIRSRLGHLSNEASRNLLETVSSPELQHVILAHLSETNNRGEQALSVVREVAQLHATQCSLAHQGKACVPITLSSKAAQ